YKNESPPPSEPFVMAESSQLEPIQSIPYLDSDDLMIFKSENE
ncbi:21356_t:CDS:1, partial [Gigaspora margarita]